MGIVHPTTDPRDRLHRGPGAWPTEWSVDVEQPTSRTASACTPEQADELITEGRDATGILPPIGDLEHLDSQLRPLIGDLAEQVRRRQTYLPRATAGWQTCEQALLQAQAALVGTMGAGLVSAAEHVAILAGAADTLRAAIQATD